MSAFVQDYCSLNSYRTIKTVIIHDRRLAAMHKFFLLTVLLYIVFDVLYGQRYLVIEAPEGTGRIVLKKPDYHMDRPIPWKRPETLPYCDSFAGKTMAGQLSSAQPCFFKDGYLLSIPNGDGMLITTRCNEYDQHSPNNCTVPINSACVTWWSKIKTAQYYVAQAEDFIVEIEHSMVARQAKVSMRGTDGRIEDGWIEDHESKRLDLCDDCEQTASVVSNRSPARWAAAHRFVFHKNRLY